MKRNQNNTFSTRTMVIMAVLTAIQIILARYLSIQINETLRISFETVPLALAGMWLGPVGGMIVALVSDILGTIIYGYGVWFPPIALGPMAFAALCGWGTRSLFPGCLEDKKQGAWKIMGVLLAAGVINAFVIGVLTTTWYQMIVVGKEGAFGVLAAANLLGRLPTKPLVILACAALSVLINGSVYRPVIRRIVGRPAV